MRALATTAVVLAALLAGCGGDEEPESNAPMPAEGTNGAARTEGPGDEPGAPDEGEPVYAALGSYWTRLPPEERIASAAEFIADNPEDCEDVAAEDLERQTGIGFGLEFPLNVTAGEVMLETCALLRDGE